MDKNVQICLNIDFQVQFFMSKITLPYLFYIKNIGIGKEHQICYRSGPNFYQLLNFKKHQNFR